MTKLIVFSDLDGTLLDHDTYDFSPALPAIQALKRRGIPLILASSKTGPEIAKIREALGIVNYPAIVENGAGELDPGRPTLQDTSQYNNLRRKLQTLPASLLDLYQGFGDMTDLEVSNLTGLSLGAAGLARQRAYTEPGLFSGNNAQKQAFCAGLIEIGVCTNEGGRFLTLSFGRTKADGFRKIVAEFGAEFSIALGDAPNDRELLLAASQAVVVRNDHAPKMGMIRGAVYTDLPGPEGWNKAVLDLLRT